MDHLQILFKARLVVPAVLLVLLWLWEAWHPFFRHQHRYRHAIPNLGLTLFNSIVLAITVSGLIAFATDWTTTHQIGLLNWFQLDHGITLVAAVVLLDGWMYLWHRANHAIPFLWRFHRTHHSDTHMDVTTASRFHIGEHILSNGLRILLIPLFGLSIWQLVFYEILAVAVGQLHHADISLGRLDRWIRWIIVTPDMHKIHHSRWQPETDSNYATVFSFWDRLAGSFQMRGNMQAIQFGLEEFDDPPWQSLGGMLKTPFRRNDTRSDSMTTKIRNEEK